MTNNSIYVCSDGSARTRNGVTSLAAAWVTANQNKEILSVNYGPILVPAEYQSNSNVAEMVAAIESLRNSPPDVPLIFLTDRLDIIDILKGRDTDKKYYPALKGVLREIARTRNIVAIEKVTHLRYGSFMLGIADKFAYGVTAKKNIFSILGANTQVRRHEFSLGSYFENTHS